MTLLLATAGWLWLHAQRMGPQPLQHVAAVSLRLVATSLRSWPLSERT